MKSLLLLVFISFAVVNIAYARPFRVEQVPNGLKFQCLTCHTSGAGGSLNLFGTEVFSNHLTTRNSSGNVIWSADLATLDSDNDGFSNGIELLDPLGTWKIGQDSPGKNEDVTNPGNASSFPVSVLDYLSKSLNNDVKINLISPNPIKDVINLTFEVIRDDFYQIKIVDVNGREVFKTTKSFYNVGTHYISYNLNQFNNNSTISGNYYLTISSNISSDIKIINISK